MGKNNAIVKRWLSDKNRSADLFNAEIFEGKQVIIPDDLEVIPGESNLILYDKNGKEKEVTRYRDIIMRWKYGIDFLILAIENQDKVHYTMPVRNMLYDSLSYTEQIEAIWKQHMSNKDKVSDIEYLSKFKKEDMLNPVITLVFYYGEEPWDGKTDIYGMLGLDQRFSEINKIQKFIPNYHINLIDVSKIDNLDNCISDLQCVLNMIQYKRDKKKLFQYINENKEYFKAMDDDSYQMAKMLMKSEKWLERIEDKVEEGERNMCKALEDLYNDGVKKGREQGLQQGIEKGVEKGLRTLVIKKHHAGLTDEVIAEFIEKSVEYVRSIIMEEQQIV